MSTSGRTPSTRAVRLGVAIRADASTRIGSGHVMRCLALARALRDEGHDVEFLIREADGDLRGLVADREGFAVATLPTASPAAVERVDEAIDARHTIATVNGRHLDWMVVDHYELGAQWETAVGASGPRILAIDDGASRDHACNLLVDHNLTPRSAYATHTTSGTELLLGPRYALLRPEFSISESEEPVPDLPETVVVSFGGADPTGQTIKALHALQHAKHAPKRVVALAGHHHRDLAQLRALSTEWPTLEVHEFVENPEVLLRMADLAIGAGGVSALERLAIGVPSIVLATAANQEQPAEALAHDGAILYLGRATATDSDALTAAVDIMANRHLREAMRRRGRSLLDGHGPMRIVRAMLQRTPVTVRLAAESDRSRIHTWRNHPAIRATAFDPSGIPSAVHDRWFDRVLADADRHLLVAEYRDTAIGVVRYDVDRTNTTAELSIFLAPEALGIGLGKPVLVSANAWLATHEPAITRIEAHVQGTNHRSRQLFESTGFHVLRTTLTLEQNTNPTEPNSNALGGS